MRMAKLWHAHRAAVLKLDLAFGWQSYSLHIQYSLPLIRVFKNINQVCPEWGNWVA